MRKLLDLTQGWRKWNTLGQLRSWKTWKIGGLIASFSIIEPIIPCFSTLPIFWPYQSTIISLAIFFMIFNYRCHPPLLFLQLLFYTLHFKGNYPISFLSISIWYDAQVKIAVSHYTNPTLYLTPIDTKISNLKGLNWDFVGMSVHNCMGILYCIQSSIGDSAKRIQRK